MRPAFTRLTIIAIAVATMKAVVAAITFINFGPPASELAMKKTASGPKSIAMRRPGESSRVLVFSVIISRCSIKAGNHARDLAGVEGTEIVLSLIHI